MGGQAVEAYTLGAAYAAFQEKSKGSLEPGKLADLVVLSRDIFAKAEADRMASTPLSAAQADHHAAAAAPRSSGPASRASPYSLSSPSPESGPVTALCSANRGSRSRSAAFVDHAMAPMSSSPRAKYGSIGLMRGEAITAHGAQQRDVHTVDPFHAQARDLGRAQLEVLPA